RSITIDQLLSHRSGIPHNEGIAGYWTEKSTINYARVPAMKEIFSLKLEFKPSSQTKYSSPGYFILASILENLYGKSYGVLIHEMIGTPLKLELTGQLDNSTIIPGLVSGYLHSEDKLAMAPYRSYSLMKGSGNLYASAADLITFLNSFDNQQWPGSLEKEMFAAHSQQSVERGDLYGYGWFIREKNADRPKAFYHGGGSFGVSALMAWYPLEKMSIVILSNVSVLPVNNIWSDIENIVLNKQFDLPVIKPNMPIAAKTLESVAGIYIASNGMELQVFAQKGKLYAKMGSNPQFEIFQESMLSFYGKKVAIDLIFELDKSGMAKSINAKGMGQEFKFSRK
ncbi:MAG: class A beta-lactamase-related serine hydrolase, partial [Flavobacterium sp.]